MAGPGVRASHRVRFSSVHVHWFAAQVDGSKLPTSGCAPVGLAQLLQSDPAEALEAYEARREGVRRSATGLLLGHGARLAMLAEASTDATELADLESENARLLSRDASDDPVAAPDSLGAKVAAGYGTAAPSEKRLGRGGGFSELDEEEESRRKLRAAQTKLQAEARKVERRRCEGCRRFACLC